MQAKPRPKRRKTFSISSLPPPTDSTKSNARAWLSPIRPNHANSNAGRVATTEILIVKVLTCRRPPHVMSEARARLIPAPTNVLLVILDFATHNSFLPVADVGHSPNVAGISTIKFNTLKNPEPAAIWVVTPSSPAHGATPVRRVLNPRMTHTHVRRCFSVSRPVALITKNPDVPDGSMKFTGSPSV